LLDPAIISLLELAPEMSGHPPFRHQQTGKPNKQHTSN
jgi:hypothetical protein